MAGWLNLGSIVLGLIAWILPIVNLMLIKKHNHTNWIFLCFISMGACTISLCFQIFYNNYLVKIEDWGALMDITGGTVFAAIVLLIVTFVLNAITLIIYSKRTTN
jgi:cytochrome c oxidase subunit 4